MECARLKGTLVVPPTNSTAPGDSSPIQTCATTDRKVACRNGFQTSRSGWSTPRPGDAGFAASEGYGPGLNSSADPGAARRATLPTVSLPEADVVPASVRKRPSFAERLREPPAGIRRFGERGRPIHAPDDLPCEFRQTRTRRELLGCSKPFACSRRRELRWMRYRVFSH